MLITNGFDRLDLIDHFVSRGSHFIECLELAMAAYPDARVSVDERGLVLRPSRPAIPKL